MDTPSSDESSNQIKMKLLPAKQGSQDPQPSSSKATPNPTPIDVPDHEQDVSKRINELLGADRNLLADSFATDLEDGSSSRNSLALGERYSDDYGIPSDKGLLLNHGKNQDDKKSRWRSRFRLHSWWSVAGFSTIALLLVWLSIRGLPWSSAAATEDEFVSCP